MSNDHNVRPTCKQVSSRYDIESVVRLTISIQWSLVMVFLEFSTVAVAT